MLRRKNFLHNALKSMLIVLCTLYFTSISLAQPWTTKTPMPTARNLMPTVEINGIIYAIGGILGGLTSISIVEVYDTNTDSWTNKSPLPIPLGSTSGCAINNKIYIFGGAINGVYGTIVDSVYEYTPSSDTWSPKSHLPKPLSGSVAQTINGKIYVIGGTTEGFNLAYNSVYEYDPVSDTWDTTKTPMPTARFNHSSAVADGKIYVFGGATNNTLLPISSVEAYDPASDTWDTAKTPMPISKCLHTSCASNGKIYTFSGASGYSILYNTVEEYDPVSDTWDTTKTSIPTARWSPGSCAVGENIYVIGGASINNQRLSTVEVYNPSLDRSVPVELVSFTGNNVNGKVLLEWRTTTELNNNGFEIQRKAAESEFSTIGFVKGQGTTTNQKEYSYTDKDLIDGKYFYRLKQIDYDGSYEYSNVIEIDVRLLDKFTLEQNYPNPFNPTTTVGYVLQEKSNVKLTLLNTIGEEIAVVVNKEQDKGYHNVEFNAANLSSGIYFYKLSTGSFVATKKMILLR